MPENRLPAFLSDAARIASVPPDWSAGARMGLAPVVPLAVGEILDLGSGAMIAGIVAVNVGVADEHAAYGVRCRLMVTAGILYAAVIALATVVDSSRLAVLVISIGVAGLAAVGSALGARGAKLGLLTAIVWTIFAFGDMPEPEIWPRLAATAAATAWVLLLFLWAWPIHAARPATRAVDEVWAALASSARRPGDRTAIRTTRSRLDVAAATLAHAPSAPSSLAGEIRAADALTSAVSSIGRTNGRSSAVDAWLGRIGDLPRDHRVRALGDANDALEQSGDAPAVVALGRVAQRSLIVPRPLGALDRRRWAPGFGVADVVDRLRHPGARQLHHALRYAVAVAVAGALALWGPFERSYWVPLTVLIVLAPTANATLAKGVQRTVGTVLGVGVGILVADVVPAGSVAHYVALAVVAGTIGVLLPLNYGIAVIFITSTIILLMSWPASDVEAVAAARLVDTLVGAAIALAVGIFVWPHHPREDLGAAVADALRATACYVDAAMRPPSEPGPTAHARREVITALNSASAIEAEAGADWSRPPPDDVADLLDEVHALGLVVFDLRLHILAGSLVPDATTDDARRAVVHTLDALAGEVVDGSASVVDSPDPDAWPEELHDLAVACESTRDAALAAVAEMKA